MGGKVAVGLSPRSDVAREVGSRGGLSGGGRCCLELRPAAGLLGAGRLDAGARTDWQLSAPSSLSPTRATRRQLHLIPPHPQHLGRTQSLVSGLQLPSLKHCCEAGKKRQLDNKTGDIEKQTHGEGNRYITCSPAPDRGLGHHSRGGRPSPLCHSSKISLSPPTTTTSHDEGDEAASPDSTMTPDCPMSPGEQDAPDLICKWVGCGLSFESLDELVSHLTAAHVTSQHGAFFCLWHGCSRTKGFNARYKMLIHIRTHTNERPYVCSQCDKRFSRQENLRIHARTHTGEKPYVCTVPGCGKAYSNSSDRFKHTRTHFVDKPYECRHPGCGKRYTDPSSLRKHVKIYGHYRRPEDQHPPSPVPPSSAADLLDPSLAAAARLDLSPSPSSMGASGLSPWAPVTAAAWTVALQQPPRHGHCGAGGTVPRWSPVERRRGLTVP
ncbi:hypothetical protein C7M84_011948 [Penaeus vannamei]|uniref:C2H2-type domain-containing protein n=1 Tax=Penaeus vannamei TaxID=6689 RepID=A0A3R7PKV7_PENVA|nr:hypothetical protein C7M84_011948 [Penaeus vannamei]